MINLHHLFQEFEEQEQLAVPHIGLQPRRHPPGGRRARPPVSGCGAWHAPWRRAGDPSNCRDHLRRPNRPGVIRRPS